MGDLVRLDVSDGVGTIRLDRPKMNALDVQMQEEIRACAARGDRPRRRQGGGRLRRGAGLRGRRGRQGDGRRCPTRTWSSAPRWLTVLGHRRRPDPQADGRGGHRLRARRRLRAGDVRRHPDRRRRRGARPARGAARDHPGRRRHPAADAAGRPGQGQGHHLHRTVREGRRGAERSGWSTGWSPRRRSTTRRSRGRGSSATPRRTRCGPPRTRDRPGSRGRPRHRAGDRARSSSPASSPPRTAASGMRSFVENGPGQGRVHRAR